MINNGKTDFAIFCTNLSHFLREKQGCFQTDFFQVSYAISVHEWAKPRQCARTRFKTEKVTVMTSRFGLIVVLALIHLSRGWWKVPSLMRQLAKPEKLGSG